MFAVTKKLKQFFRKNTVYKTSFAKLSCWQISACSNFTPVSKSWLLCDISGEIPTFCTNFLCCVCLWAITKERTLFCEVVCEVVYTDVVGSIFTSCKLGRAATTFFGLLMTRSAGGGFVVFACHCSHSKEQKLKSGAKTWKATQGCRLCLNVPVECAEIGGDRVLTKCPFFLLHFKNQLINLFVIYWNSHILYFKT